MLILVSSLTIASLSTIALIGHLIDIPTLYTWSNINFMALKTAVSLLLLSIALLLLYFLDEPDFIKKREVLISSATCLVLFTLLILFWQMFERHFMLPIIVISVGLLTTGLLATALFFWQEVKRSNVLLDHLAHYDPITDLPNRNYFHEIFKRSLATATRNQNLLALLFLDLDYFKNINDSFGHHLGDLLLKEVGKLIRSVIRETDFLARLGGDEFVIIAESLNNINEAEKIAERILKLFKNPICIQDTDFKMSISIGIAVYPYAGNTIEKLLQNADQAMYQAKESGRNNFKIYTETSLEKLERSQILEQELRLAVERNELSLIYQPIFDLHSNTIVSVEALLRWHNKLLKDVAPNEFIPLAETTGLIVNIGEWVFKEACKQLSQWQTTFPALQLELTVNCSVFQFDQQQRFINYTKQIIQDYQLPSHKIILELTETGLMKQVNQAIEVLNELKNLGFSIAIDDFGSGYSSLNYLKSLPISILKIDQSFTKDLEHSVHTQEITKTIIQLAKILELNVIAEGVETEDQLQILKQYGCQYAQGFYFAKPMTASSCEQYLQLKMKEPKWPY